MPTQYRVPVLEQFEYQQKIISILSDPPVSPAKGDRYIVGANPSGQFQQYGQVNAIAWWDGASWKFDIPTAGWQAYVTSLAKYQMFNGLAWIAKGSDIFEQLANKSADGALGTSDTLYPTQKAVKTYADGLVAGLLDDRGAFDASGNVFPSAGGSGAGGVVMKGDLWFISVAGILGGVAVNVGDSVRALSDAPGQTATNWSVLESNIGYVPENVANKDTDGTLAANSDTKYASQKATKTYADTKATLAQVKADVDVADALAKKHAAGSEQVGGDLSGIVSNATVATVGGETAEAVAAAVGKAHTAGTDQGLDTGGPNAVTAAQAKEAYSKRGIYAAELKCVLFNL